MKQLACSLIAACAAGSLFATDGTWTAASGGNWSDPANWAAATPASNSTYTAYFTTGSGTVTNDLTGLALKGVQLSGSGFTLAGNTLSLDSAGFITALGGSHTVNLPLALQGNTNAALTAASGQTLTIGGAISGNGGLAVNGGRVVLANANSYNGQTVLQTGLLEIATLDALGSGTAPVSLGNGTFRFAGTAPADLTRGYTVYSGGGTATTVLDVRTNLTVSGKADAPAAGGGRFLKIGPGTLTYTYAGYQTLNRGGSGWNPDTNLVIDTANGGAGTQGYYDYTIADGKVVFNTPGQTNRFISQATIGVRYPAAAAMEINAGVVQAPDTWFSISRGNGDTNNAYSSSLTVTGGRLELWGLIMGYAANMPGFKSYPRLTQTGGAIAISADSYVPENGTAATLNFSGGTLTSDGMGQGFDLSRGGAGTVMNISDSAVVSLAKLRVNTGGTLNVTNGGTLALRSTTAASPGTVVFDNGMLTTYAPLSQPCDWFNNLTTFKIRAGGMTANVPAGQFAFLGTPPAADPTSLGGKITKTGTGTLALYNTEMPIDVNAGRLKLMGGNITTNRLAKTVTLAANAELELAVPHAADADTLSLSGTTKFELTIPSLGARTELWQWNSSAIKRTDGLLEVVPPVASVVGSVFMTRPVSVTNAWQASFSLAAASGRAYGYQGDGVTFVIQNDARGASAYSTNLLSGFGYAGAAAPVTNSFAVALDLTNRRLRFGTNGVFAAQTYDLSALPGLGADMDKTYFAIAYDGTGTVTCTLTRKGLQSLTYTFAVNLQTLAGGTQAYLGFTAGNTSARFEQHMVGDVAFTTAASAKSYGQYGGKVTLGAGQALNMTVNPAAAQNGFGLGQLTYADGSVLNIQQPQQQTQAAGLSDKGMWKLNQAAHWLGDGRLAVSSNAMNSPGTAFVTNLYPVAGSWVAKFGYDIGNTTTPPADYFAFIIQNSSPGSTAHTPTPGFSVWWRYYEGGVTCTSLRIFTNGVQVLASTNIVPVSLINKQHANMTLTYDAVAKSLTVMTVQAAGTNISVFAGIDIGTAVSSQNAYVGFGGYTGGLSAENIVSDFAFTPGGSAGDTSWQRGYLAFGAASGSGTLVKRGNVALGVQDSPDNPFTNATVRLDEGGLLLRKPVCEPVTLGDDFYLSKWASWAPGGALQTMYNLSTISGNAVTAKRHVVSQPWTTRFTFFVGARGGQADGFSFFVHNDPRGPAAIGDAYSSAGYFGSTSTKIVNSIALEWNYYEGDSMSNTVVLGVNGAVAGARRSNLPIKITTILQETDMVIRHDPVAKTLALTMAQGTNVFSTTFTGVDIPASVGGNLGYIGFGAGGGGAYCETRVKDFRFTLDTPTNPLPVSTCLGTAILSAGSTNTVSLETVVPNAAFAIGSAQVGAGATLGLESVNANGGTLSVATNTLSGDAAFIVSAGTTLSLANVSGGAAVTKSDSGTLTLTGTAATYTGATRLTAGTLSLPAALLPSATDLYVTTGATLNLAFTGKQYVHTLTMNGVKMPGGQYTAATASWITGAGMLVVIHPSISTFIVK